MIPTKQVSIDFTEAIHSQMNLMSQVRTKTLVVQTLQLLLIS